MYWAKQDASKDQYDTIRENTVDFFMSEAIETQTEFDLASPGMAHSLGKSSFDA